MYNICVYIHRIEALEMWCRRKMLNISWQEHRTNDSILTELGLERELMGRVAKATIFWPHYSAKCRTVGTYSPRRNHGRVTASRQTEKTMDTRHWREDWLQIHSAKGDVKIEHNGEERYWSGHLLSPTLVEEGRLVSEWVRVISTFSTDNFF